MMASIDGPLSIDVTRYLSLPPDVRVRFDCWLTTENLYNQTIVKLKLGEGRVVVERYDTDDRGRLRLDESGELVKVICEYPVSSLPPQEALHP